MPKVKSKKWFIRKVHLQAIAFLIFYNVISKTVFFKSVVHDNLVVNFLAPYVFGVVAGIIFLYLLNHEDFFHFMKEVESRERSKENFYIKKYKHYGRILSTLIIATIGGPIFAALTIRFLLNTSPYRYIVLAVGNIASTLLTVSLAKGTISLVF